MATASAARVTPKALFRSDFQILKSLSGGGGAGGIGKDGGRDREENWRGKVTHDENSTRLCSFTLLDIIPLAPS